MTKVMHCPDPPGRLPEVGRVNIVGLIQACKDTWRSAHIAGCRMKYLLLGSIKIEDDVQYSVLFGLAHVVVKREAYEPVGDMIGHT